MTDLSNVNPESRSDTVMASPDKIAKVRDLRPGSIEVPEQEDAIRAFERARKAKK